KDHISRLTAVCEDVDLEGTRHLDMILLEAVLRAFNLILKVDELEKVFGWIDVENREAITAEQFIAWLTDSVETIEQKEMQQRMFDCIDRTVNGDLPMSQGLQDKEKEKLRRIYSDKDKLETSSSSDPKLKNGNSETSVGVSITSRFRPAPTVETETIKSDIRDEQKSVTDLAPETKTSDEYKPSEDDGDVPLPIDPTLAEFSDQEDEEDGDVLGELPSLQKAASHQIEPVQVASLAWKLE
ncbi:hypothetical protein RFI_33332, partial [Reticulomyxa filosa]